MNAIRSMNAVISRFAALLAMIAPVALAQGELKISNLTVLPDGIGQFEVHTPDEESYSLQVSFDLQSWEHWTYLSGEQHYVMQTPGPVSDVGAAFLRMAKVGVATNRLNFSYDKAWHGPLVGGAPAITWPQELSNWRTELEVHNSTRFPPKSEVIFRGPAGSGIELEAAKFVREGEYSADYELDGRTVRSAQVPIAPGGTWTVEYGGENLIFEKPDPSDHYIMIVPEFVIDDGQLTSMSWTYRNPITGADLGNRPEYVSDLELTIFGSDYSLCGSNDNVVFTALLGSEDTGVTFDPSIPWENVALSFHYESPADNKFNLEYAFGELYQVWGGDIYPGPPAGNIYCDPAAFDFTLLGSATSTATFEGAYDFYLIRAPKHNVIALDSIRGSNGVFYPISAPWDGNTEEWWNYLGEPDGEFARVGAHSFRSGGLVLIEQEELVPPVARLTSVTLIIGP